MVLFSLLASLVTKQMNNVNLHILGAESWEDSTWGVVVNTENYP